MISSSGQGANENELKALDSVQAFVEQKQNEQGKQTYSVFCASAVIFFARCDSLPTSNEASTKGTRSYRTCTIFCFAKTKVLVECAIDLMVSGIVYDPPDGS